MNSFRLFAGFYCLGLGWRLFRDHARLTAFAQIDLLGAAPQKGLSRRLPFPAAGPEHLGWVAVILGLSLVWLVFGNQPLLAGGIASLLSLIYLGQVRSHPWLRRKADHFPIGLALLAVAPGMHEPWQAFWGPSWLLPFQLILVQAYVSSGLQKLRRSGLAWLSGETLRAHLWEHWLWGGFPACSYLVRRPLLCKLACWLTLTLELSFPLSLLHWKLGLAYLIGGGLFHWIIAQSMGIDYLRYFGWLYFSFLPCIVAGLLAS